MSLPSKKRNLHLVVSGKAIVGLDTVGADSKEGVVVFTGVFCAELSAILGEFQRGVPIILHSGKHAELARLPAGVYI